MDTQCVIKENKYCILYLKKIKLVRLGHAIPVSIKLLPL